MRRVGKRLFACPPLPGLMPRSAWANDKAVCPPYRATNPPYRVDARAGLPGRELRDRLRPQGVEGGLHRGQALPAPGCTAAPRLGRRLGGEPWRLLGAQARRASRPQGHVDRLAAFAKFCHCHRCTSVSWRKMCITMSGDRGNDQSCIAPHEENRRGFPFGAICGGAARALRMRLTAFRNFSSTLLNTPHVLP